LIPASVFHGIAGCVAILSSSCNSIHLPLPLSQGQPDKGWSFIFFKLKLEVAICDIRRTGCDLKPSSQIVMIIKLGLWQTLPLFKTKFMKSGDRN